MKTIKTTLVAGAAFVVLTSIAAATPCPSHNPCPPNNILNGQINLGNAISDVQQRIVNVTGEVTVSSAAIGNNLSVDVVGDAYVGNTQINRGIISSNMDVTIFRAKDVTVTSAAIANSASIKAMGGDSLVVDNLQRNVLVDPVSNVHANISHVAGDVTLTSAAMSNSMSIETDAALVHVGSTQTNHAPNISKVDANIRHVTGNVTVTSAAIGNSLSIKTGL